MSGDKPAADLEAEREIDLRSWLDALRSRWWIAVAGLVIGAVIGGVYSLSGGSTYVATAFIAPGQAFNPSGNSPVLTYLTSQAAIKSSRPRPRRSSTPRRSRGCRSGSSRARSR